MKVYFVHDGKQQQGPYSLEELKQQSINEHSLIWTDQLKDWTPAGQVDQLKPLFTKTGSTPPPLKRTPAKQGISRNIAILGVVGVVIAIAAFMMLRPKTSSAIPKTVAASPKVSAAADTTVVLAVNAPEEIKPVAKQPAPVRTEKFNVAKYLVKTSKIRKNFVGQTVIEGNIKNISPTSIYKDIALDVKYFSKTGAVISTQRLMVYEVAKPNKPVAFKFKLRSPTGTNNVSAEVVDAIAIK